MSDPYNRGPSNLNKPYITPSGNWKDLAINVGTSYINNYFNKKFGPKPEPHPNPNPMMTKVGAVPSNQIDNRVNWQNPKPVESAKEETSSGNNYLYWLLGGILVVLLVFGFKK